VKNQFPPRLNRETFFGAICWILSLEFLVGQAIAQLAWKGPPAYSLVSNAISDLGVTTIGIVNIGGVSSYYGSTLYVVMNASFIFTGLVVLTGIVLTRRAWPWSKELLAGFTLIALAGLGKIGAGLNPGNVDFTLHFVSSLGIVIGSIGMIFVGRAFLGKVRWVANFSQFLGVLGVVGFTSFLIFGHLGVGGLLERIGSYPLVIWCSVMGVYFIFCPRRDSEPRLQNKSESVSIRQKASQKHQKSL